MNRTYHALLALWVVIISVSAYLANSLIDERTSLENAAQEQALAYVRLVEEHASATIDRTNQLLLGIADHIRADDLSVGIKHSSRRRKELERILKEQQKRTRGVVAIAVMDAAGDDLANSIDVPAGASFSNRAYFLALKAAPTDKPIVSEAIFGRISKKWGIHIARRLDLPDGRFGGVVVANLGLVENFESFYETLAFGKRYTITLRGSDNRLMTRFPRLESQLGKINSNSQLLPHFTANEEEGVVNQLAGIDNVSRFTAFRRLTSHPSFYVTVGLAKENILQDWLKKRNQMLVAGIAVFLAGLYLTFLLWCQHLAEKKACCNAALLMEAQEMAGLAYYNYDIASDEWTCSAILERIYGIDANYERSLESWLKLITTKSRGRVEKYFHHAQEKHTPFDMEYQFVRQSDGELRWVHSLGKFVYDSQGQPQRLFGTIIDITSRKLAEEQIEYLAFYDALTELPNRRLFIDRLNQALSSSAETLHYGAVLQVGLDCFKSLSDTQGREVGDDLLKQIGQRLKQALSEEATVARLGGDGFLVLLENLSNDEPVAAAEAHGIAEEIRNSLNQPYRLKNSLENYHFTTVSLGSTLFLGHADTVEVLLKQTDSALSQAKQAGRNSARFFNNDMQSIVQRRAALGEGLRQAIASNSFVLHYQPQVDRQGNVVGAEALLRWQPEGAELMGPATFIPFAEETGLILPIGDWVLHSACQQIALWACSSRSCHLVLSINISVRQFYQTDFVARVEHALCVTGANAHCLQLELSETVIAYHVVEAVAKMQALRNLGVSVSLDSFAVGQASLTTLQQLPLDRLKIDQSFVRDIDSNAKGTEIIKTIIGISNSLHVSVIAEGVETASQRSFLENHGCIDYQGYLFSQPVPLTEFEALLP